MYPQVFIFMGFSPNKNHPAIGVPPWRAGNLQASPVPRQAWEHAYRQSSAERKKAEAKAEIERMRKEEPLVTTWMAGKSPWKQMGDKNGGYRDTPKKMVYFMENSLKTGDLGVYRTIFGNLHRS